MKELLLLGVPTKSPKVKVKNLPPRQKTAESQIVWDSNHSGPTEPTPVTMILDVFLRAKEVATYTPKSPQRNPFILTALLTLVSLQEGLNIIEPLFLKEFLFGTRVRWTTHS